MVNILLGSLGLIFDWQTLVCGRRHGSSSASAPGLRRDPASDPNTDTYFYFYVIKQGCGLPTKPKSAETSHTIHGEARQSLPS